MSITSSVANGAVIVTESTRVEYRAAAKARKKAEKRAAWGNVARGHLFRAGGWRRADSARVRRLWCGGVTILSHRTRAPAAVSGSVALSY
ncbi:hypothetical protein AGJ34_04145 [Cronobacter dublinensis subsp. dublinensis]|nr:hypothetical protein [Cronobacter dublinensis subsp. dublinensis]EGT5667639.1 hypothetical protein [Cronobacter dublinensis subsp. dublinensis]EGT5672223.1 hypothetical protein [Cronobacter dublinensis subsp. dublinensis]EGT5678575.1 hypothetical protein [Cronobacter dublinensis subsp. dublinensis]EGT5684074.1 hypothetical protein [Cronobacter dublinensis subsp. dublinensis]